MTYRLITAEITDSVLEYLAVNFPVEESIKVRDVKKMLSDLDLQFNELQGILESFERKGFITANIRRVVIMLRVHQELHDFFEKGGFSGDLAKLKAELKVLESQLDSVPSDSKQKLIGTITNVGNLIQGLTFGLLDKI